MLISYRRATTRRDLIWDLPKHTLPILCKKVVTKLLEYHLSDFITNNSQNFPIKSKDEVLPGYKVYFYLFHEQIP